MGAELVGHERHRRVGQLAYRGRDLLGGVVVEPAVPALPVLAAGHQHADLGRPVEPRRDGVEDGLVDATIGALHHLEGHLQQLQPLPCVGQSRSLLLVGGDVDDAHLVRPQGPGVLDGPGGGAVERVDEHEDAVAGQQPAGRCLDSDLFTRRELGRLGLVLAVEPNEHGHHHGDQHHDEPGPVHELGDADHDRDDAGGHGAEAVDGETEPASPRP